MSEQAGRELDALVAEKVMGWESITDELEIAKREGVPEDVDSQRWHRKQVWFKGNERMACEECGTLPDYSTSIAAAWEVVVRLAERGIFLRIEPGKDLCVVRTWDGAIYEDANTAPLAICLAAIKAISNEAP